MLPRKIHNFSHVYVIQSIFLMVIVLILVNINQYGTKNSKVVGGGGMSCLNA